MRLLIGSLIESIYRKFVLYIIKNLGSQKLFYPQPLIANYKLWAPEHSFILQIIADHSEHNNQVSVQSRVLGGALGRAPHPKFGKSDGLMYLVGIRSI